MKINVYTDHNGVRQLHWRRILLFSAIAPGSMALIAAACHLVAGRQMSATWPWSDGAFIVIAMISWGAFAGGLIRAVKSAPLEPLVAVSDHLSPTR